MDRRYELQTILENTIGSTNVYFQPPSNLVMKYPCVKYHRLNSTKIHADNLSTGYLKNDSYLLTLIDINPDSGLFDKILNLPYCTHDTHYVTDGLNHDTFTLYF